MNSLLKAGKALTVTGARGFASSHLPERKVVVLGAAGGIGQPLGLLMKVGTVHVFVPCAIEVQDARSA